MTPSLTRVLEPSPASIAEAGERLRSGQLVAFPTETVYGLGADARSDAAVTAIFEAKDRPRFNPLIVHFADVDAAFAIAEPDARAQALADAFWPGPLTMVLPRREAANLSLLVSAGLDTVAVRVPSKPVARDLLRAADCPVAAPSANRSSRTSPTTAGHVVDDLGRRVSLVIDGGPCGIGLESTVIDLSGSDTTLLRPGGLAAEAIEAVVGPLGAPGGGRPKSPGMLSRHYAPGRPLRANAQSARDGEAFLGFGPDAGNATLNLSRTGDLAEAAANFFAMIRSLDRNEFSGIAVAPVPEVGLGRAINDRLRRAAAPAGTEGQ